MKLSIPVVLVAILLSASSYARNEMEIDASYRDHLDLTVFNSNFAVVRDMREVVLPTGDVLLEFKDVALTIDPRTVDIKSNRRAGFTASRQNYRYDLLNRSSLLANFIGRKVKYSRSLLEQGNYERVLREGILLSINPEIVKFGDVIEVAPVGTISLPYIPEDLKTTPTLLFAGKNDHRGAQDITARYHMGAIRWDADYSLSLGKSSVLDGWVTIQNNSNSTFEADRLRLIAGDVSKNNVMPVAESARLSMMSADAAVMKQSPAGDYHAYEFPEPVEIIKNDVTQLKLLTGLELDTNREYWLSSQVQRYGNPAETEQSPIVRIKFTNTSKRPIPAGVIRVYEDDAETFIGEANVGHTASAQDVTLDVGRAFDLVGKRTQTSFRRLGERSAEVSYRIEVANAREGSSTVFVEEQLFGDWEIVKTSQTGKKTDAVSYLFELDVPGEGDRVVEYTVRMNW